MPPDPLTDLATRLGLEQLDGQYVHGYRADNWLARSNMGIEATLFSTEVLTLENPASFVSIRNVPIEALRTWSDVPPLALLPRAQSLVHAHNIRIARDYQRPLSDLGISAEQANRITRLAEYELAFEEVRRRVSPDAPSRLSCIYLAEDTIDGRNYASQMATIEGFVLTVRVPLAIRSARLDARWLGSSLDIPADDRIRGYWSGEAMSGGDPVWEWLVDGVIRCVDPEEFLRVRRYNASAGDVVTIAAMSADLDARLHDIFRDESDLS